MTTNKNRETKTPGRLQALVSAFGSAFTRIKLLFSRSTKSLPNVNTGNTVNIETPPTSEQKNIAYCNPYLLLLPPGIRNKFFSLASTKAEINPSLLNHAGNHSTLALLNINNLYFWGFNNTESPLTPRDLNYLRTILKAEKSLSAYSPFLLHPEADAIMKALKQKMTADRAIMFIERKQCGTCGGREFNTIPLRRLLPVLSLKELAVYTTNSTGKITKLLLSPLSSNTSDQNLW